jgi:hypothetical protein
MKYKVGFSYTEVGTMEVEAKSEREARCIVDNILGDVGLEDGKYECRDREYGSDWAEKMEAE